ncbi:MAG: repressor LexA [Candidatus Marinimicrobia bacterium]|jgi:repressor LexA|nr:repressor LexA [Candidatus Neomarinimicrobiota bacterium]|tara:strand:+ start:535 stop:1131 length:597 start_codon:yes stop_codon:yes gene_type:complete
MLSPKKQKFLDFIKNFISTNDRPPTFVEIMKGLKFSSLGTINWYIVELESEGLIKRVKGSNGKRALSILEKNIDNRLPMLGLVAAGMPIEVFENIEYVDVPSKYINNENYVLKVDGNSMIDDGILDGDYIVVKKSQIARAGDTVVAILNGEATLKRYYLGKNGVELHPRNKKYNTIHVTTEDELYIQGQVLGVFREYN